MVRDDAQTVEVMWSRDGVLKGINSGSTIIILSTVNPPLCQKLHHEAAKKNVGVLDAPVSGAKFGADTGTLNLMVGGDEALFNKMVPILKTISINQYHMGPIGMGEVAKLANNIVAFASVTATTEALAFAAAAGLPVNKMLDLFNVSTGSTWVSHRWHTVANLKKDHSPASTFHVVHKDLNLGLSYAKELDVDLPLASRLSPLDLWREVD
jgi:3-hydroxyisobutyrate dehydrogenase